MIEKALDKHLKEIGDWQTGGPSIYRSRSEREVEQERKGGKSRDDNWQRRRGVDATLEVPATVDSKLAKQMQTALDSIPAPNGAKVKATEGMGRSTRQFLSKSDPFPVTSCDRPDCLSCLQSGGSKGKCYKNNAGYQMPCRRCLKDIEDTIVARSNSLEDGGSLVVEDLQIAEYRGETKANLYTRGLWHLAQYRARKNCGSTLLKSMEVLWGQTGALRTMAWR